ncbi:hypothetical protein B0H14DRAFT_2845999 [Mycena olivaceomarginata]|nr:hypothetical protein B0H14DRAFT_2845999 [Mycena olivaceomarginata]
MPQPLTRKPPPLLALPPELIQLVALHLATAPPNLGPPAALLPLLSVCRRLHALLGWGQNWAFWAKVGRAKFTSCDQEFVPYEGYPWLGVVPSIGHGHSITGHAHAIHAAHALRARCTALSVLRRGDPSVPGAVRALKIAYGMLIEDDWAGEKLDWTALGRSMSASTTTAVVDDSEYMRGKGKNRRQLAWAGARAFALRYVLERLYEGRYGERDADDDSDAEHEHAHLAWRVGWPRDTERAAAALWVLWFFEGEDTLRAEPEPLRRYIMDLLLPMVVAPFRYPSALAPPHHYTVPLLPAVYTSPAFDDHGRITVPTHHGAYPLYALGAAAPARARGPAVDRNRGPRPQAGPRHARRHQAPAPRRSRHPQHRPRARLLVASPARVLFFARMQATVRMGVPPHLPRDQAEARAWFREEGGIGPPPVRPTQADIHEKNARPSVRFERALPSSGSSHRTRTSTMATTTPTPPSTSVCSSTSAHRALTVDPELDLDLESRGDAATGTGRARRRDARWAAHRWRAGLCRGYGSGSVASIAKPSSAPAASSRPRTGGAPPGRIGRVYPLGSFAGLWAGTMLMPSEAYNALLDSPGGALPPGGLARDEFVAAARPVYMRMREHWRWVFRSISSLFCGAACMEHVMMDILCISVDVLVVTQRCKDIYMLDRSSLPSFIFTSFPLLICLLICPSFPPLVLTASTHTLPRPRPCQTAPPPTKAWARAGCPWARVS